MGVHLLRIRVNIERRMNFPHAASLVLV